MKILSIDFDYVMWPSIEAYKRVENLKRMPGITLQMDYKGYQKITHLCLQAIANGAKFEHIQNHEEILQYLPKDTAELVQIVNVDYHHDCGYCYQDKQLNCGNWVQHVNNLMSYTWIRSEYSQQELAWQPNGYVHTINMNIALQQKYDLVVLCASDKWVPEQFRVLEQTLYDSCCIAENMLNNCNNNKDS